MGLFGKSAREIREEEERRQRREKIKTSFGKLVKAAKNDLDNLSPENKSKVSGIFDYFLPRQVLTVSGVTVVYRLLLPNTNDAIKQKLTEVLTGNPKANLYNLEKALRIAIESVDNPHVRRELPEKGHYS